MKHACVEFENSGRKLTTVILRRQHLIFQRWLGTDAAFNRHFAKRYDLKKNHILNYRGLLLIWLDLVTHEVLHRWSVTMKVHPVRQGTHSKQVIMSWVMYITILKLLVKSYAIKKLVVERCPRQAATQKDKFQPYDCFDMLQMISHLRSFFWPKCRIQPYSSIHLAANLSSTFDLDSGTTLDVI